MNKDEQAIRDLIVGADYSTFKERTAVFVVMLFNILKGLGYITSYKVELDASDKQMVFEMQMAAVPGETNSGSLKGKSLIMLWWGIDVLRAFVFGPGMDVPTFLHMLECNCDDCSREFADVCQIVKAQRFPNHQEWVRHVTKLREMQQKMEQAEHAQQALIMPKGKQRPIN